MTTIADVAKLARVSVATVSRTLHGSTRVDPRTRERVLAAAAELQYVASPPPPRSPRAARMSSRWSPP